MCIRLVDRNHLVSLATALAMLAAATAIYFTPDFRVVAGFGFRERMRLTGRDVLAMVRSAIPLLTLILIASPISAGAINNLWSRSPATGMPGEDGRACDRCSERNCLRALVFVGWLGCRPLWPLVVVL